MAIKDHSLDEKIILSAKREFLEYGYSSASLRKIVERAGITTGALYTRYRGKDQLFSSLLSEFMTKIKENTGKANSSYDIGDDKISISKFVKAINLESAIYLEVLFKYYDECTLFFCKSEGSSIGKMLNKMIKNKEIETVNYLKKFNNNIDEKGISLILNSQFSFYRQILDNGYTLNEAVECMKTVNIFIEAGWKQYFKSITNTKNKSK